MGLWNNVPSVLKFRAKGGAHPSIASKPGKPGSQPSQPCAPDQHSGTWAGRGREKEQGQRFPRVSQGAGESQMGQWKEAAALGPPSALF